MTIQELRDQRAKVWEQAKALNEKVKAEKRLFTAEEDAQWKAMNEVLDGLERQVQVEEQAVAREREFSATNNPGVGRQQTTSDPARTAGPQFEFRHELRLASGIRGRKIERTLNFLAEEDEGPSALEFNRRSALVSAPAYADAFRRALRAIHSERRDMQADVFNVGGALVPPLEFIARLIQDVDDEVFIRQFATVLPLTTAAAIGAPSLDADAADSDWTTELQTGGEETSLRLGRRELSPKPLAKRKKISKKLIRASAISADALVRERLAYKQAITQEKAFLSGSGAGQPLGVFTASADGISTARDVSAGNAATDIGADGLINALYSLKPAYQNRAIWGFHRDAVRNIRKLKTGDGQYLWVPGLSAGQPDSILSRPFFQSEYVPNTFTTGLYVGIVGDFSNYWIAEALGMTVEVLTELYAETNENGYILRSELDGMPVLEAAFARVKLA